MGTSLASLHIPGGDIDQVRSLLPEAAVGAWSERFVSVFSAAFLPGLAEKEARALSKKIPLPVLAVWLFDSDAVGFRVFLRGKTVVTHILNPDGVSQMGNIPLFCQILDLPEEDVPRLRAAWKKGDAEEQLALTGTLPGAPLYHDSEVLPEGPCRRDAEQVDRWIRERPAPPRIKNQAKAQLIQELPGFRMEGTGCFDCPFYVSVEPWQIPHTRECSRLWQAGDDGTVSERWSSEARLRFFPSAQRILCADLHNGTVAFDSAGLLPLETPAGDDILPAAEGKTLQRLCTEESQTLLCRAAGGGVLWRLEGLTPQTRLLAQSDRELLLLQRKQEGNFLSRIDLASGRELAAVPSPLGLDIYQACWRDGGWWSSHDGRIVEGGVLKENRGCRLTRLAADLSVTAEVSLPSYSQSLFFSPDGRRIYVFFFQEQVIVLDGETLAVERVLREKAFLGSLGFDRQGRFWLQRDNSTVEAWDAGLTAPLSRHRLKGAIAGHHWDLEGRLCAVTEDEKKCVLRVYCLQ